MTDDDEQRIEGDEPAEPQPKSPSAAAARRARRIGGRAVTPTGADAATPAAEPAGPAQPGDTEPVELSKAAAEFPPPPAPQPQAGPGARPDYPAWVNWAPAGVLIAGAVAMAILMVVFSHGVWWGPDASRVPAGASANEIRERVLAAAKTCVADTNTYKYTDLDAYETKALSCATGEFAGQLKTTIDTLIKVNAPKSKSSQTARIDKGGIEAVSPDGSQWTVLLYGQLGVTNSTYPKGRTDPFAAQVVMQRANGGWLIAKLSTVSSPLS